MILEIPRNFITLLSVGCNTKDYVTVCVCVCV